MSKKNIRPTYFEEQMPIRMAFTSMLSDLHAKVSSNRASRTSSLAGKDIKLLRNAEGALVYLATLFDTEWRVCLPAIVGDYTYRMEQILTDTMVQLEPECKSEINFLSIIDVQTILEDTKDIIHYLTTSFDANRYFQKQSFLAAAKTYIGALVPADEHAVVRRISSPTLES